MLALSVLLSCVNCRADVLFDFSVLPVPAFLEPLELL
jgi:hypothetical protein